MTLPTAKTFWWFVVGFVLLELVSWAAYSGPRTEQYITSLVTIGLMWLAWKRPVWLAYASIAELIVGGKGYLLFFDLTGKHVSIRMIIFSCILLSTLPIIRKQWNDLRKSVLSTPLILFVGWLVISVIIALIRKNSLSSIYTDANAYVYVALLPVWWMLVRRDPQWRQRIMALLFAGATVIGLKSWLMVLLFGQNISNIHQIYLWIRNTGIGEITFINNNVFRVFFQSQISSVFVFCATFVIYIRQRPPRWMLIPLFASALGVYISLSRSFWLGLAVAMLIGLTWFIKVRAWHALWRLWIVLPLGFFAWAMVVWAISFPVFNFSGSQSNIVGSRLNGTGSADAATARTNQIKPLFKVISLHPVLGSGFGTTVTYFSTDPRTRGWKTTTAFELGYLDLWLKLGAVGTMLFAVWIFGLWRRIRRTVWSDFFLLSGLALVVIHLTTPYLNHPLGLGWLMLTSLYAYDPE